MHNSHNFATVIMSRDKNQLIVRKINNQHVTDTPTLATTQLH